MTCNGNCGCKCGSKVITTDNTSSSVQWGDSNPVEDTIEEKAKRLGVPVIPPLKPTEPLVPSDPINPNPVVAICGECGLELHQTMGYVCTNPRCPTGLGPVICSGFKGPIL